MSSLREELYTVCDPATPVRPDDQELYVNWPQQLLATDDPKLRLANSIVLSRDVPQCRFVTGHRGVGKTTELLRAKAILERGDAGRRIFVSFVSASRWIQAEDIEAKDILFHVVRRLMSDLEDSDISVAGQRWKEFLKGLWQQFAQDLRLDKATIDAGPISLEVVLRSSPDARREFRALLDRRLTTLYDLVNESLSNARRRLQERGFEDIVVIIDELDRMPFIVHRDLGVTNQEQIFFQNSNVLRGLACDVVYTVPIELAYSPRRHRFQTDYSAEVVTVPLVPLFSRDGTRNSKAREMLEEVLRRRVRRAGGEWNRAWSEEVVERLLGVSGGYLRQVFLLIRSALERSDVPITAAALDAAVRRQAIDMTLPLTERHWRLLHQVRETKQPPPEDTDLFNGMLRDLYVLAYEDDAGSWYDWNPLISEARTR